MKVLKPVFSAVLALAMFLATLPTSVSAAKPTPEVVVSLSSYTPGQTASLFIDVTGRKADFEFQIVYGKFNEWWSGGSGPVATTGGTIKSFDCNTPAFRNSCSIVWNGTLPKGKVSHFQLYLPLSTTTYKGSWPNAIVITGTVDGVPFSKVIAISQ